ncbi:SPFH domain-containing protein [Leucobacter tenebrionis]|uniref:SPFH domain-containing protein n=1 Tax=Leucobacter tenebrionis TaxID=2873270 RepID=UPI001CA74776|nr:SPFH domain-containing protein [Leucobacter tenebrionis]QZY52282.1 SPFH domain-containing protein [Leucobacter tenebrionis]
MTASPEPVATEPVGHDGIRVDISERPAWHRGSAAGIAAFLLGILAIPGGGALVIRGGLLLDEGEASGGVMLALGIVVVIAAVLVFTMFTIVAPGQTSVRQFFGRYVGTVRNNGISFVAPFTTGRKVSVRVHNFETNELKVNDSDGNPIHIAAIVVWQVADTAKAVFAVEAYDEFIETQAEAALRHVATTHPYDEPGPGEQSLRGSTDLVSAELAEEVAARVAIAGLEVLEVRISSLAYAPEIAQAMLQRQQASAIIAAREKIVEGAVTMVDQALTRLEHEDIVSLDDERRAQMVSNLLLVLTSDQRATPVINAGSLYS